MGENDISEILRFLESMDTPDLSMVGEFLQAKGVSAEKLRLAQEMLEQMGIRYDSQPQELPDQGDLMSLFNQLSSGLDSRTRQQFEGLLDRHGRQGSQLSSSEDVVNYLRDLKKE
ncbi:MAG: hypothetical protein ABSC17_03575 [Thermacetogeniaceae bacterium]